MTKEEFHNEKMYQATMGVVRRMHSEGLISQEEYARVEQVFLRASCQNSRPFVITLDDYTISTTSGVEPI